MSGDVQPRKRKDKKKKREDDETKEQHQGVHQTKMGEDDIHLHVHSDHGTGGHWCAKIFFFALLAILLGLTGIIILENQGQDDVDTPLSESRFSNYFDGWVDEHRQDDHAHDPVIASIEEHEDEHDDEPFDEEEDHSELEDSHNDDEHDEDEEEEGHDEEADEDEDEEATEEVTQEDEDEENTQEDEEDDEETGTQEDEDGDEEQTQEDDENTQEDDEEQTQEDEDNDEDEGIATQEDTNEDDEEDDVFDEHEPQVKPDFTKEAPIETIEIEDTSRSFEEVYIPVTESVDDEHIEQTLESVKEHDEEFVPIQPEPIQTDDDENDDDDDDDVVDESNPKVVDNDAEELALLQEKARQQEDDEEDGDDDEDDDGNNDTSSIYVKLLIGVALALVARFIIFKRNQTSPEEDVSPEALMKRRLTIAPQEEMPEGPGPEDEFSEEEIEIEEEIIIDDGDDSRAVLRKIVPESFRELENLYRNAAAGAPVKSLPQQVFKPPPSVPAQQFIAPVRMQAPVAKPAPPVSKPSPPITPPVAPQPVAKAPEPIREPSPDEEILDYEEEEIEYEEEYEEEEIEEEMEEESDVDDEELMRRLDSKYGTIPQREYNSEEEDEEQWQRVRGGPQDFDDDDEDDDIFEREFRRAEEHLSHQKYQEAFEIFERLTVQHPDRPKAFLGKAKTLDVLAEIHQSNNYLRDAIKAFKRFLAFEDEIDDDEFLAASKRCAERMQFLGNYMDAANVQKSLIERFPNVSDYRNQLAVSYLSVNRLAEAKRVLHETLLKWRKDGVALVHYGFVCKALDNNCTNAVMYLKEGIETGEKGTQDGRFYFNLGECLQRLGRYEEAKQVFKDGAKKNIFLSEHQRSLYNVRNLKAQPIWTKEDTTYTKAFNELEKNWEIIKEEGLNALRAKGLFEDEAENLRDFGDWKQFELFQQGHKNKENCAKTPITCGIIESFPEARSCKRGQVKFSVMHPGTHVWPHCGPTNCRLRAHLGLVVPEGTRIRVADEERSWEEGKFLIFDDSFEHEVWHNGSSLRLVLIVDIWHPDLTKEQRLSLSPI